MPAPCRLVCYNVRRSGILSQGASMDDGGCFEGCLAVGTALGLVTAAIIGLIVVFVF